jgi:hypothetical protein
VKPLFLGHFAATVSPRIVAEVKTPLDRASMLDDEGDAGQLVPLSRRNSPAALLEEVTSCNVSATSPAMDLTQAREFR